MRGQLLCVRAVRTGKAFRLISSRTGRDVRAGHAGRVPPYPIVDLHFFAYRNFAVGTVAVAIGFGLYFAALVLVPLWLQTDMEYNATWAGLVTAPMGVFAILLAPFLGAWVRKGDARLFASLAFFCWAAVAFWRANFTTDIDAGTIALTCLAQGIGIGFFLTPLTALSLFGIPPERLAAASGLQTAIRMMSGNLIASLAQTFWDRRSRYHQAHLVETLIRSIIPTVARAIEAMRAGRMVIMVDDDNRENEGDLVMAAEFVTPDAINFMITHGRGLVCLPLAEEYVERLSLPMMADENTCPFGTAFTVSIDAKEGTTTGISANDRARTIRAAIEPGASKQDFMVPGHIFPLKAAKGGTLSRRGHTERSVDLARLSGLKPAGVLCEILNEDGTMARRTQLDVFSQRFDLPIISIADILRAVVASQSNAGN